MDIIPDSQVAVDVPVDQPSAPVIPERAPASEPQPSAIIPDDAVVVDPEPSIDSGQIAPISDDDVQLDSEKYSGLKQGAIAAIEGFGSGVLGPIPTAIETQGMGVPAEDILGRREEHPWAHGIGQVAGIAASVLSGVGAGAIISGLGKGAAQLAGLGEAASIGAKLAQGAVTAATEMGFFQASDEATKELLDPTHTLGKAATSVGLAAALGGVTGPIFTAAGLGLKKVFDSSALKDFVEETAKLRAPVTPAEAAANEFTNAINVYEATGKAINGAEGLKSTAIKNLLPKELNPAIVKQTQSLISNADEALKTMIKKNVPQRMIKDFQSDVKKMMEIVTNPESSPAEYFDALNTFRGDLWANSKGNFGPFEIPKYNEAYNYLNITKELANDVKTSLQDSKVWGKAADLQKDINKSWHGIIKLVDQVKPKFMTKIGNEFEFSNDKWQTYFNKAGKATSPTDKQAMLGEFIDKMSQHFNAVDNIYEAAGVSNPFPSPGMPTLKESLNIPSYGTKLARTYAKVTPEMIGSAGAVAVGGGLNPSLGGAFVGEKILGPMFRALSRATLDKYPNIDYNYFNRAYSLLDNINKGNSTIYNSTRELFKGSSKVIPSKLMPTKDDIKELDEKIKALQDDFDTQSSIPGGSEYYLPEHATAMTAQASNAINYLNAQRPVMMKSMPFDEMPEASSMQKAEYNRVLTIAQQPLTALQHIKDGTILPQDVKTLHSVYPELYNKISKELLTAATEHMNEGGHIPYHVKQGLSLFLGQAIDSSFTPFSIQSAQSVFAARAAQQAQINQAPTPQKGGSPASKVSETYSTADQAAQKRLLAQG